MDRISNWPDIRYLLHNLATVAVKLYYFLVRISTLEMRIQLGRNGMDRISNWPDIRDLLHNLATVAVELYYFLVRIPTSRRSFTKSV